MAVGSRECLAEALQVEGGWVGMRLCGCGERRGPGGARDPAQGSSVTLSMGDWGLSPGAGGGPAV